MGQRHILHCDCNCFYASVEMQEHPELRGKSIAVCGDPEARHGIVLTASYPAKRMGVKTGMPIWEAKQHCRDLIIVPASYGKYQKYSGYVREVFNDYTDQVESFGLDEAWLDITGSVGLFGSPVKIAREISVRIKRELGITVSIGVSFNKITAKLGSDYKKPDAITIIEPENYKEIVYPLPAGDLLYDLLAQMYRAYGIQDRNEIGRGINRILSCNTAAAMCGVLEEIMASLQGTPEPQTEDSSAIIRQVQKIVDAEYGEPLSLEYIAEKVYITPSYLSYIFKQMTGQNLIKYITDLRMYKARRMVADSNLKISQIAKNCGYDNPSYFNKLFKNYFGVTPRQYREGERDESIV